MDPELAQEKGEDQLGHQERLDDGELSGMECDRLESEPGCSRDPAEEPKGLADEERHELPAALLRAQTSAGGVLCHQVHRVG